jgi:NhaA family Na+:H+ antiporter
VPRRFVRPLLAFTQVEASAGVVLLGAALAALVWANLFGDSYTAFWDTRAVFSVGLFRIDHSMTQWVNEGLMAFFFFIVGLELKRELVLGELADRRTAVLPAVAAAGGMIVPALLYLLIVGGGEAATGWGIAMPTDLTFALGVLYLIPSVPVGARLFLLALAITDDIGSILVIGLFYPAGVEWQWLVIAGLLLTAVAIMSRAGIRSVVPYVLLAVVVWVCFVGAQVSTSIAAVALALLTPVRAMYSPTELDGKGRQILDVFAETADRDQSEYEALELTAISRETVSPLRRLETRLHPWVAFGAVPMFALANAGIALTAETATGEVAIAVAVARVVGKPIGILVFTWLALRFRWGRMPASTNWGHVLGIGILAGVGFTVAFYVAGLAFGPGPTADGARLGLLAASLLSGLLGWTALSWRRVRT